MGLHAGMLSRPHRPSLGSLCLQAAKAWHPCCTGDPLGRMHGTLRPAPPQQ